MYHPTTRLNGYPNMGQSGGAARGCRRAELFLMWRICESLAWSSIGWRWWQCHGTFSFLKALPWESQPTEKLQGKTEKPTRCFGRRQQLHVALLFRCRLGGSYGDTVICLEHWSNGSTRSFGLEEIVLVRFVDEAGDRTWTSTFNKRTSKVSKKTTDGRRLLKDQSKVEGRMQKKF
jgi:hypothetical protein